MNIFNIILTAVLMFSLVHGFISGLLKQIGIIFGLILGVLFTNLLSPYTEQILAWASNERVHATEHVSYVITFVVIFLAVNIAALFMYKTSQALKIGWIDHLGGALFGFVKYLLIVS
ncbi:MAG: CvpA family protein, partial [Bacteroidales bacterium]